MLFALQFKPKQGEFDYVVHALSKIDLFDGIIETFVVKINGDTCCSIGILESEAHLINAPPHMIAFLDTIQDKLDIISDEHGVTAPLSGPVIHQLSYPQPSSLIQSELGLQA